jgi:hypothetical protein
MVRAGLVELQCGSFYYRVTVSGTCPAWGTVQAARATYWVTYWV